MLSKCVETFAQHQGHPHTLQYIPALQLKFDWGNGRLGSPMNPATANEVPLLRPRNISDNSSSQIFYCSVLKLGVWQNLHW